MVGIRTPCFLDGIEEIGQGELERRFQVFRPHQDADPGRIPCPEALSQDPRCFQA